MADWHAPRAARRVHDHWDELASRHAAPRAQPFTSVERDRLPEPADRWIRHAVPSDAPEFQTALLTMHGEILIGSWRRFRAIQIISPSAGFIWAAETRIIGLPVRGFDRYRGPDIGEMNWRVFGAVPIVHDDGPDVARSAAGRLAAESIFVPTALDGTEWTPATESSVVMHRGIDSFRDDVTLHVHADGSLRAVTMKRWGRPPGRTTGRHEFAAQFHDEQTFDGITVPSRLTVGWPTAADSGDFFRATITDVCFR